MTSIWITNKTLRHWLKKHGVNHLDGDFCFDILNPISDPLITSISKDLNMPPQNIYITAGISQIISMLANINIYKRYFLNSIEFGLYERSIEYANKEKFFLKTGKLIDMIHLLKNIETYKTDLLCFSSPRWFDGEQFTMEQIENILQIFNGDIYIDEAYVDYADNKNALLNLSKNNSRILLGRSFSKRFMLSSLRVGYLVTSKKIDGLRDTLIPPHSVSSLSNKIINDILNDNKLLKAFEDTHNYIKSCKNYIITSLKSNSMFQISNSKANFITLIFDNKQLMVKFYNYLKDCPGVNQYSIDNTHFIKIWIFNEPICNKIINQIKEATT